MKKSIIFVLSLLCIILCSCKKEPKDLLLGTWEVSVTMTTSSSVSAPSTHDGGVWFFSFDERGRGRMVQSDDTSIKYDFTYKYDKGLNSILYTLSDSNEELEWEVIILTRDRFVFSSETSADLLDDYSYKVVSTLKGEKIM